MAEQGSPRAVDDAISARVARPLAGVAHRSCARPSCRAPASATLGFAYHTREVWLAPLAEQGTPATYDLCADHADRTRAPHGWRLEDERPATTDALSHAAAADQDTVTVLAAALRALPSRPHARGSATPGEPAAQW